MSGLLLRGILQGSTLGVPNTKEVGTGGGNSGHISITLKLHFA